VERAGGVERVHEQLLAPGPDVHRAERHEVRVADGANPPRGGVGLVCPDGARGAHEPEQHGGLPGAHRGAVQRAVRGLGHHLPWRLEDGRHRQRLPAGELDERLRPAAAVAVAVAVPALRAHAEALGEGAEVRQRAEAVGDGREVGQHGAPAGRAAAQPARQAGARRDVAVEAQAAEARAEEAVEQVGEQDADDGKQDGVAPALAHRLLRRRVRLGRPRHLHRGAPGARRK
jgi:hypothetical protein